MIGREHTRKMLIEHYHFYPKLKIQDIFKFLYQSSFGCEHLVSSLEKATLYIAKEYENIDTNNKILVEPLDGNYSRVSLSYLDKGLSVETFAKLFVASAKKEENGLNDLILKIEILKELVFEGLLNFKQDEFNKSLLDWKEKGYPAIHHSDTFREEYKPAYRLIANQYIPFLDLFTLIDKKLKKDKVVAIIEGKNSCENIKEMLEKFYDCTVSQITESEVIEIDYEIIEFGENSNDNDKNVIILKCNL